MTSSTWQHLVMMTSFYRRIDMKVIYYLGWNFSCDCIGWDKRAHQIRHSNCNQFLTWINSIIIFNAKTLFIDNHRSLDQSSFDRVVTGDLSFLGNWDGFKICHQWNNSEWWSNCRDKLGWCYVEWSWNQFQTWGRLWSCLFYSKIIPEPKIRNHNRTKTPQDT